MHVEALWRYPVKSLGGEPLTEAELTPDGVAGDRLVHVGLPWGPLTGRTKHGLLTIPASTGPDGRPLVAGLPWDGPEAAALIREVAGPHARLTAYAGPERFDVLNLLVATDGGVADLGVDVRAAAAEPPDRRRPAGRRADLGREGPGDRRRPDRDPQPAPALRRDHDRPRHRRAGRRRAAAHQRRVRRPRGARTAGCSGRA